MLRPTPSVQPESSGVWMEWCHRTCARKHVDQGASGLEMLGVPARGSGPALLLPPARHRTATCVSFTSRCSQAGIESGPRPGPVAKL